MTDAESARGIIPVPLADALGERYLSYALSTIVSRSLPDVRDGLKPVHRRLLYAMRQLRLSAETPPKKAARVVGDVIGKFHPHGEVAVYDALVRLAQDFAARYPLIDGQGNFGSIDGDSAAAMRYTEARLTAVAEALLDGIEDDAVDLRLTYDEDGEEPAVLPARFPNLLANGSQGIAVGLATSIPPHNVGELCDALSHLIHHPEATASDLVRFVPGPDFPTGGVLIEPPEAVAEAYASGRGSFRLRARWTVEKLAQGQYQVVVTEIPYQVQKSRLIEKIADILNARKVPLLADVRDESTSDVRIVLEPKSRNVDADVLMEQLFRLTDLETRFSLNMNVLDAAQVPRVMSLADALRAFLEHRHDVLVRRSRHRLGKIDHRLEVLDGYLIAYLNIDEVIAIIREADDARAALMGRFDLTEVQADAILNMRLRALRRLEEIEIRKERDALAAEREGLTALLDDPRRRWKVIGEEIDDIKRQFGPDTPMGVRRTEIGTPPSAVVVPIQAVVEREPITVYLSEKGWIRAVRGHQTDHDDVRYKDGDRGRFALHAETTDRLLVFATNGRFYTLAADRIARGRGFGEPVRMMVDLPNDADVVELLKHDAERRLLVVASDGRGFVVREADVVAQTRAGKQVLNVAGAVEAKACAPAVGDTVAIVGTNRKLLVFPLAEVPEMARGRGVILQKYRDAELSDVSVFAVAEGLQWRQGDRTRTENELAPWLGRRAQVGRQPPHGFPRNNRFN